MFVKQQSHLKTLKMFQNKRKSSVHKERSTNHCILEIFLCIGQEKSYFELYLIIDKVKTLQDDVIITINRQKQAWHQIAGSKIESVSIFQALLIMYKTGLLQMLKRPSFLVVRTMLYNFKKFIIVVLVI